MNKHDVEKANCVAFHLCNKISTFKVLLSLFFTVPFENQYFFFCGIIDKAVLKYKE